MKRYIKSFGMLLTLLKHNTHFSVASSNKFEGSSRTEVANIANQTAYNVSKLLDNLLQEYDNVLRPDFGGEL